MAPIWDLKWRPKRGFEIKLALGSSKNEVLGAAFENVRIFMNFRCENACKIDPFYVSKSLILHLDFRLVKH